MVLLYLRIFLTDSRMLRFTCWGVIATLILALIAFEFATIFQCIPVKYNWTSFIDGSGHCTNQQAQIYTSAAFNIFFDVVVLLLPMYHIVKLRISWVKKFGVMCVLLVGVVVIACSIVRLQYLVRYGNEVNVTWYYAYIGNWSIIEVYLSIICVCMPATAGLAYRGWKFAHGQEVSTPNKRSSFGNQSEKLFADRPREGRLLSTTAQIRGLGVQGADLESGNSSEEQNEPDGFYFDGKWFSHRRGNVNSQDESEIRASKEHDRIYGSAARAAAAEEMAFANAAQEDIPANQPEVTITGAEQEALNEKFGEPEPEVVPSSQHLSAEYRPSNKRTSSAKSEDPLRSNGLSKPYEELSRSQSNASADRARPPSTAQNGSEALHSQGVSSGAATPNSDDNKIKAGITRSASSSLFSSRRPSASYARSRSASRRPGTPGGAEGGNGPLPAKYAHSYVLYDEKERPKISPLQPKLEASDGSSDQNPKKSLTSRSASSSLFSGQRDSKPPATPEQRSLAGSKGSSIPQLRTASEQELAVEAAKACLGVPEGDPQRPASDDGASTTSESSNPDASPGPLPPPMKRQDDNASIRSNSTQRSQRSQASRRPRILTDDEVSLRSQSQTRSGNNGPGALPSQDSGFRMGRQLRHHPDQSMQSLNSMATNNRRSASMDSLRQPVLARQAGKTSMNAMRTQSRTRPSEDSGSSHPLRSQTRTEPCEEERRREYAAEHVTNIINQMNAHQNGTANDDEPSEHRDSNDSAYSSSNSQDEATNKRQQERMDVQYPHSSPSTDGTFATADEVHPLTSQTDFMPYEAGQKDKEITTSRPNSIIVTTPRLSYELRQTLTDVAFDKPSAEQISAVTPAQGWRHHMLEHNGYFPKNATAPAGEPPKVSEDVMRPSPRPESIAAEAENEWADFDQGLATNNPAPPPPPPRREESMELHVPSPQERREGRLGHSDDAVPRAQHREDDYQYRYRPDDNDCWEEHRPRDDLPPMERGMSLYQNQEGFNSQADVSLGPRSRLGFGPASPQDNRSNRSQNRSSGGSSEKWGPVRPNMNHFKSESTIRPTSGDARESQHLEEEHRRQAEEGRSVVMGQNVRRSGYYEYDPPSAEMINAVAGPQNEAGIHGDAPPSLGDNRLQPLTPPTTAKWDPVQSQPQQSRRRSHTHDHIPRSVQDRRNKAADFADYVTSRPSTADTSMTAQTAYWNPRQSESDYAYGKQPHSPALNLETLSQQTYSPASPRTAADMRPHLSQRRKQPEPQYDDQGQRVSPVVQQAKQTEIVVNHESPKGMSFPREESEDSTYSSTSISSIDFSSGNETSPSPPPTHGAFRNSDGSATTQSSGNAASAARKKKVAQLAKELIQRSRDEEGDYSFHPQHRPSTADGDEPLRSPGMSEKQRSKYSPADMTGESRFGERSLSRLGSREAVRPNEPVEIRSRPGGTGRELRSSWQG